MIFYKSGANRSRGEWRWKGAMGWLVLGVGLIMVWSLIEGVVQIKKGYWRLSQAELELKNKEKEREAILRKKEEVQSGEYIERVIRDDLRMQKEGEVVVVLPKEDTKEGDKTVVEEGKSEVKDNRDNWQKWWGLIK